MENPHWRSNREISIRLRDPLAKKVPRYPLVAITAMAQVRVHGPLRCGRATKSPLGAYPIIWIMLTSNAFSMILP